MARRRALLLQLVKHEIFQRRIDVEAALDLCVSKLRKKTATSIIPGRDARRRRDGAAAPRDAALYSHVRHEARLDRPARRVVSTEKLHLLLVGAHGRRDLLAEGGHGSLASRCAAVQKECCSLPEPTLRGDGEGLGGL